MVKQAPRTPRRAGLVKVKSRKHPTRPRVCWGHFGVVVTPLRHDVNIQRLKAVDARHARAAGDVEGVESRVVPWSPDRLLLLIEAAAELPITRVELAI